MKFYETKTIISVRLWLKQWYLLIKKLHSLNYGSVVYYLRIITYFTLLLLKLYISLIILSSAPLYALGWLAVSADSPVLGW